jgi:FKBP-type peptidyl-prolyl cis-trans isomerase SlyD
MSLKSAALGALLISLFIIPNAMAAKEGPVIEKGRKVKINYTIKVEDEVIGSTEKTGPYEYVQGSENMLIGVQKRLEGLKKGDTRQLVIPPEEGFGRARTEQVQEVPKANLPPGDVKPGDLVVITGPDGREERVPVVEVRENSLLIDFNHPLAGKTLKFDVTVVDVT